MARKTTPTAAKKGIAAATGMVGTLNRGKAFPALVGDPKDWLIIAGLAGTAKDTAALCKDMPNYYALAGVMGGAVSMGLGLALARPDKKVLVATGDGELLMNVGALATVAIINPPNLSILCVDNGHYGETGYQRSHTSLGVDLAAMASGAGIAATRTVSEESQIPEAAKLMRESNGTSFVLLKISIEPPPGYKRSMDAALTKTRFRDALMNAG